MSFIDGRDDVLDQLQPTHSSMRMSMRSRQDVVVAQVMNQDAVTTLVRCDDPHVFCPSQGDWADDIV